MAKNFRTNVDVNGAFTSYSASVTSTSSANVPVVLKGAASQDTAILNVLDSSNNVLASIGTTSKISNAGSNAGLMSIGALAVGTTNTYGGKSSINTVANGNVGLVIRSAGAGQTADLQQWQNSSASILASVSKDGLIYASSASISGNLTASAGSTYLATTASAGTNRITHTGDKFTAHTAAVTSSELAGVISDETGSGSLVFSAAPTFTGTISGAAMTLSGALTASAGTTTLGATTLSSGTNSTTFNADGSLTGSGSSMAAVWSTYTPTIGGFTATAGSASGRFIRIGKTVYYHIYYRFGGTPTWTGFISVSLPNSWAAFNNGVGWNASVELSSSAGVRYLAHGRVPVGTGSVTVGYIGTNGVLTAPATNAPFTWTASSLLSISGFYETTAA